MKAFPDARPARPRCGAFWLVNIIPCVQIWHKEVHVGLWRSARRDVWNPVMRRPFVRLTRFGVDMCR